MRMIFLLFSFLCLSRGVSAAALMPVDVESTFPQTKKMIADLQDLGLVNADQAKFLKMDVHCHEFPNHEITHDRETNTFTLCEYEGEGLTEKAVRERKVEGEQFYIEKFQKIEKPEDGPMLYYPAKEVSTVVLPPFVEAKEKVDAEMFTKLESAIPFLHFVDALALENPLEGQPFGSAVMQGFVGVDTGSGRPLVTTMLGHLLGISVTAGADKDKPRKISIPTFGGHDIKQCLMLINNIIKGEDVLALKAAMGRLGVRKLVFLSLLRETSGLDIPLYTEAYIDGLTEKIVRTPEMAEESFSPALALASIGDRIEVMRHKDAEVIYPASMEGVDPGKFTDDPYKRDHMLRIKQLSWVGELGEKKLLPKEGAPIVFPMNPLQSIGRLVSHTDVVGDAL